LPKCFIGRIDTIIVTAICRARSGLPSAELKFKLYTDPLARIARRVFCFRRRL